VVDENFMLEHLVYGAAATGREGRNMFQVVAASAELGRALDDRSRLGVAARRLCYINGKHAPGQVSLGWIPFDGGLFLFRREPHAQLNRPGGFTAHVLWASHGLDARHAVAVLRSDLWMSVDDAQEVGPELGCLTPPQPLCPTVQVDATAALIDASLATFRSGERVAIAGPSSTVLDLIHAAVESLPVRSWVDTPFSTYEHATDASNFLICGVGEPQGSGDGIEDGAVVSASSRAAPDSIGALTVAHPGRFAEASSMASTPSGEFAAPVYETVMKMFVGADVAFTAALVDELLGRPQALALALSQRRTNQFVVEMVLDRWKLLGQKYIRSLSNLDAGLRRAVLQTTCRSYVTRAADAGVPDVGAVLVDEDCDLLAEFMHLLAADVIWADVGCAGCLERIPACTAGLLAKYWPIGQSGARQFDGLCSLLVDRDGHKFLDQATSVSVTTLVLDRAIERRSRPALLHLLATPGSPHLLEFGHVVAERSTWEADLFWIVEVLRPNTPLLDATLHRWSGLRTHRLFAQMARLYSIAETADLDERVARIGAAVRGGNQLTPKERRITSSILERTLLDLVAIRRSSWQPRLLEYSDTALASEFAAESALLSDLAAAGRFATNRYAAGWTASAFAEELHSWFRAGDSHDARELLSVLLQPAVCAIRDSGDAEILLRMSISVLGDDVDAASEVFVEVSHAVYRSLRLRPVVASQAVVDAVLTVCGGRRFGRKRTLTTVAQRSVDQLIELARADDRQRRIRPRLGGRP
jgi:hypothetical protein